MYIFGITILFRFQMNLLRVLIHLAYFVIVYIVSKAIKSIYRNDYKVFSCFFIYVCNIILYLYGACVYFYILFGVTFIYRNVYKWYDQWRRYVSNISILL